MRVYCNECGGKGRISSRNDLSKDFTNLYCQCLSPECGHTWVANLTFSHTLNPSAQAIDRFVFGRLREMTRAQQRDIFEQLERATR
ncbi:Ogr/Delta-like zinc finger [compost metagenome]|uniref:ogr/Delta-like zinc finger family protein n=1 Tax=Pseudomonas sp. UC 17F4 TaxID=1855328 RepID=UPI00088CBDA5|nr:ogr/Delta-like zinc finger family protein [Pseudomonas sp. UC 17F4]SDQ54760.1 Ogr/Delta-like zinc finger [Pseudomonas sp. UC 17F4]